MPNIDNDTWDEIAYGITDLRQLFGAWAAVGEGVESIRKGEFGPEHAAMFSATFDIARKLEDALASEAPVPPAAKPSGSPADNVFYAEMKRRMADLEDSYKNAPRITAGKLDDWRGRIASLEQYLTAAMDTVCLLNADERDATAYYGPLKAIETTLEQACEEATGLSIVVTAASRERPEGKQASPGFAARIQAWREARDKYEAADERDDATIDPLHDAKQAAYNALLAEPVRTFGDVLEMAHTIKEEDNIGTRDASPYEPAFEALIGAVESLAGEG